jgi:hypothetical protein
MNLSTPSLAAHGRPSGGVQGARELDGNSWRQLVRNEIPAVVIRGFATPEECERLVDRAQVVGAAEWIPAKDAAPP